MTAAESLIEKLTANGYSPRPAGGGWSARCPAHEDRNPSLSVRQIEGMALVRCHAGCRNEDVVEALGLSMRDLFDEPTGARYTYTDPAGQPTRTVHRSPDKRFRQSGDTTSQPQLYRLHAIPDAVKNGRPIYLVEGEKDVHALESIGAVATTSPMGSSNWRKVDPTPLAEAHVVVVPDQDEAGRRYLTDVLDSLDGLAASVKVARPKVGKDAADHVAAGYGLDELALEEPPKQGRRSLKLTRASDIEVRPVRWLWNARLALGSLALLGGREGIGKSTVAYTLAADVTRGRLLGTYAGQARAVIVAATEDSWSHTIVPRLMAADADLDLVYRVDVNTSEGVETGLSLPRDLHALEESVREVHAALILLDPLMSRLDTGLDTHKDAEVRLALEPVVAIADRTGAAVLGLIHVNKSQSGDPLTLLMGSRAFAAVARAVLFVMLDPDDEATRLLGQPKNNLGSIDLPTLTFRIESTQVAETREGPVVTGRVHWLAERAGSIREALEAAGETSDSRSATAEAAEWLHDHLVSQGGTDDSASIKDAGRKAGHSIDALKRARPRIKAVSTASGFPRRTYWSLPGSDVSGSNSGETAPTALTALNGKPDTAVGAIGAVGAVGDPLPVTCSHCGEPLLLRRPGRDVCARCELAGAA